MAPLIGPDESRRIRDLRVPLSLRNIFPFGRCHVSAPRSAQSIHVHIYRCFEKWNLNATYMLEMHLMMLILEVKVQILFY